MAAELGLISLTQLQKLVQSHHNLPPSQLPPNSMGGAAAPATWMFMNQSNHFPMVAPRPQDDADQENKEGEQEEEDEESNWEVKAFEEDTNNAMGTTWPPRSYTCTFCRREFRSAQALGGHMNVHRRDRARLHQSQPYPPHNSLHTTAASPTSPLIIPTQDFMPNGGLCLVYSLPQNPNSIAGATLAGAGKESRTSSKLISDILPHPHSRSVSYINFPVAVNHPSTNNYDGYNPNHGSTTQGGNEEIDLELRLGRAWPSS